MTTKSPKVDAYLARTKSWKDEQLRLRDLLLDLDLSEDLKWGKPCYAWEGKNVAILQPFKAYCALMFFKGALLEDPEGLLVAPGANSQAGRQLRFESEEEVAEREAVVRAYVGEAVAAEQAGRTVPRKETADYPVPDELRARLEADPKLKAAFEGLTPGRQRAYLLHFSGAKQSKTRAARVEKAAPRILQGKGLND